MTFRLTSWRGLWSSAIPLLSKLRVTSLIVTQALVGPFRMWTHVDYRTTSVRHSTRMTKWGLALYRSEKTFALDDDGVNLRLEGVEYFWPLGFVAVPFAPLRGTVEASGTRAHYQMPLAGTVCEAYAVLEAPVGYMEITTPWLRGRFELDAASNARLLA